MLNSPPVNLDWAIAVRPLITVSPETPTLEVLGLLHQARRSSCRLGEREPELEIVPSCAFVMAAGELAGIVTERDFVRLAAAGEDLSPKQSIREIMSHPVQSLRKSQLTDVFQVAALFRERRIRHLPILDDEGKILGCITENSLRRVLRSVDLLRLRRVEEVMDRSPATAPAEASILEIAQRMSASQTSAVLIGEPWAGNPRRYQAQGLITERDLLQFQALGLDFRRFQAKDAMSAPLMTIGAGESLELAYYQMQRRNIQRLAVVGEDGGLEGLLTQASILQILDPAEMYGVMEILQEKVRRLEQEKLDILTSRNQQLESLLNKQARQIETQFQQERIINEIVLKIRQNLDLDQTLAITAEEIKAFFQVDRCLVYQFEETSYRGKVVAEAVGAGWSQSLGEEIEDTCFDEGLNERYLGGDCWALSNIEAAELTDYHRRLLERFEVRANLVVPIIIQTLATEVDPHPQVWGLLILHQCSAPRVWQAQDIDFLKQLADQLAIAAQQSGALARAVQEIQERQKVVELSQHLQERLTLVLKGSKDGWWDYDATTGELYIAPRWWEMLGYQAGELPSSLETWQSLIHPDDLESVNCAFEAVLAPGGVDSTEFEYRLRHREGHYISVLSRGYTLRDNAGLAIRNSGANTDLTPLKQKETALQVALEQLHHLNEDLEFRVRQRTQALEDSESRFRAIIDSVSDGIIVLDSQGDILFANPVAVVMFRRPLEELIGLQLGVPLIEGRAFDLNIHRGTGEMGVAECLVAPIQWQGQQASILCLRDATERKAMEEKYAQENRFRRQIMENMAEGLCVCRAVEVFPHVEFVVWNPQMETITGYSLEEINALGWYQSLYPDPDYQRRARERMERMRLGDNLQSEHWRITRKDGEKRTVSISTAMVFDPKGKVNVLAVIQDISDRKQMEETLRRSEARYRSLMEQAGDAILLADPLGNIIEVNQRATELFGYSKEEFITLHFSALHSPEKLDLYRSYFQEILEKGSGAYPDIEILRKDGVVVPADLSSSIIDWGGRVISQGIFRDVSERKEAERQLQASYEQLALSNLQLERASRLKDEFLANMSHELRTPLNAVLGMSQALEEEVLGPLTPKQKKAVSTINSSGRHLLTLINDILDLSKIEAGKLELDLAPTHLQEMCQLSLQFVKQQAFKKQITLTAQLPPQTIYFQGDERRLRQALINLLNNAVKFTPDGGQVSLTAALNLEVNPPSLDFEVRDTGIGISQADQRKLFQAFTQIDSKLSRHYEGTGLGLALVKHLTELHGGRVGLTSEPGQGSRFTVSIPYVAVENAPSPQPAPAPESQPFAQPPYLLLVEDNVDNVESLKDYLEYKGYRLGVAYNGQEALDSIAKEKPDLILMDVQMPVMDGIEAARRIRANPDWQSLPIIALTALTMPGDRERFLAAGMNDHISKPVHLRALITLINQLLGSNP